MQPDDRVPVVTFDVFSALTDSRSGGSAFLQSIATGRGWPVSGVELYDRWDSLNKQSHRAVTQWVPFADLSTLALRSALAGLDLPGGEAAEISRELLLSMADWPLWPDVSPESLAELPAVALGLLSNIDDQLLAGTAAMRLGVFDPRFVVTSERVKAYKPAEALYHSARELLGPFVHVASSARDVRGAVTAGIPCVRLARPGHAIDPAGPTPRWTADSVTMLADLVGRASES